MQDLGALASRGVAVLMRIPAETIRPHLSLTCNLQVAGNEKRTIRGAQGGFFSFILLFYFLMFVSSPVVCNCPGFAFVSGLNLPDV